MEFLNFLFTEDDFNNIKVWLHLDDFSFLLYLVLFAVYFLIYKAVKNVLYNLSTTKISNIELMITHYTEIHNSAISINEMSNEEQYSSFYNTLRISFNYIEYPVYQKITKIIDSNDLSELQKIKDILQIVYIRNKKLIPEKNKFLDYSFTMSAIPAIKQFVHEFRHIISAAVISLFILILILTILIVSMGQPNKFEMAATVVFSLLFASTIFMFIDRFKELSKSKSSIIILPILMVLMFAILLSDGCLLYIELIIFALILISLLVAEYLNPRTI